MRLLFKNFKPPSSDVYASGEAGGILNKILRPILPALIIFSMYANLLLVAIAGYRFFSNGLFDPVGILIVVLMLAFALVPIEWCDSDIGFGCMGALLSSLGAILNVKVVMEDEDGLKPGSPCVIGLEPHSALPLALPAIMGYCSPFVPKPLRGRCYALTSSVCFMVPFVRQIFYTAGARPADRKTMQKLLEAGQAVVIVPGGVQECLYMTSNDETAFLKSRQGFVRMALQTGASLVPAFAFNQGKSLHWYRPGPPIFSDSVIKAFSRATGFAPLFMWGRWGSTLPFKCNVTLVIGKAIQVPAPQSEPPSPELIEEYLQKFITELQALFERHKDATGCGSMTLKVV